MKTHTYRSTTEKNRNNLRSQVSFVNSVFKQGPTLLKSTDCMGGVWAYVKQILVKHRHRPPETAPQESRAYIYIGTERRKPHKHTENTHKHAETTENTNKNMNFTHTTEHTPRTRNLRFVFGVLLSSTFALMAFFTLTPQAHATVETFSTAVSSSWTAPANVYQVQVECWGAGGAGGGGTNASGLGGGGGGGGAYVLSTIAVTPGNSYSYTVGAGGSGGTGNGPAGANTTFNTSSCIALGGGGGNADGSGSTPGAGGTGSGSTGTIKYSGGTGLIGQATVGGGGGGSGGTGSNGNTATTQTGSTAVTGGGPGGDGGASGASGVIPASGPGGGGGGGGQRSGGSESGGSGYAGQIRLTYVTQVPTFITTGSDPASITIAPGAGATTSNTFTLRTGSGTDVITALVVNIAHASSTSLIEITDSTGATVYGSTTNPTGATTSITLSTNTLTATTATTTYNIRITPKSHTNLPIGALSMLYPVVTSFASFTSSGGNAMVGTDTSSTTITIDNQALPTFGILSASTTFAGKVDYTAGTLPYSVAIGDLNNDGFTDLAVANYSSSSVSVFMGNGDGTFAGKVDYTTGASPSSVAIGDLNNDGKPDLAVANNSGSSVSVFINNGDGTFAGKVDYTAGSYPYSVAIGDLNNDGKPDLAVANGSGSSVSVFINNGDGTFAGKVDYTTGTGPFSVAIGDLNNDGKPDLAVANYTNSVSVFINNGDGTFAGKVDYTTGSYPFFVAIGDLNNDGKPDLAVANGNSNSVSVFMGNGDGTFAGKVDYTAGLSPRSVAIGDLNNDGKADLAVANYDSASVSVFINNSTSTLTATAGAGQATISYITPFFADIDRIIIFRSISPITDVPVDDTTYTGGETIGSATVACVDTTIATSTADSCVATSLIGGTPYYIKVFVHDTNGNYSYGVTPSGSPVTPAAPPTTTLTTGSDPASITIAPGASATTSDTFTFQTTSGTDVITAMVVNISHASSTALIEITSSDGATVYGSNANPTGTTTSITLSQNTLMATTATTTYKIRITPKSQANLPIGALGMLYPIKTSVASWTGTNATSGSDVSSTTITIDNQALPTFGIVSASTTFAGKVDYTTGSGPYSVTATDLNNDGFTDLAVANYSSSSVSVFINNGNGTYATKVDYTTGSNPLSVTSADLNNDGFTDLAVANYSSASVSVLINNGNGTYATKVDYTTMAGPSSVVIGDLNNDGFADLAVADFSTTTVSVLFNNGNGTYAGKVDYTTGSLPYSVTAADLNNDGFTDLAVANYSSASVSVLINNGNGTFATKVDYTTGSGPRSVTAADLNNDGYADLAVANNGTTTVSVFINNGNGTYATKVDYTTGSGPYSVTATDLNNDGFTDLAVANNSSASVSVLINNGNGTYATKVDYTTGTLSRSVTATDLNNDGFADLAVANFNPSSVSVLLNNSTSTLTATAGDTQATISYTTPPQTEIDRIVILRSTSTVTNYPVDDTTYTGGETIGSATVACVDTTIATSTADSCTATGLTNGTPYYFKAFTHDTNGNYSTGIVPVGSPVTLAGAGGSGLTLSGTLYSDEGTTQITTGKTISVAVATGTVSVYSTTTDSGTGNWSITVPTGNTIGTGTPMTIWVDGDAGTRAALATKASSTANITNLNLYQNRVIISHEGTSGTSTTNANMAFYDGDDDADIQFTSNGGVLSVLSSQELYIAPNKTFAPGGNASTTDLTIKSGATMVAPAGTLTVSGTYRNDGTFTHNDGTLVMNGSVNETITDRLRYVAGRNSSGSVGSPLQPGAVNAFATFGDYLYVAGGTGSATACSQTAGSAFGCELMVYDISTPTNPIYVAGRDAMGNAGGTASLDTTSLAISGNYLYMGKSGNATACSQTAGSAIGCELMVFDISSTTNPIYVAGRDAMGNADGTANLTINFLTISGNYLYVGKAGNATACSQTAGSALGCEIMVFDISSTTNPVYVAGRDVKGDNIGTGNLDIKSLAVVGSTLYVGKAGNETACDQTAGSLGAVGCELMVFDISSSTNPVYFAGRDASGDSSGTGSGYVNSLIAVDSTLYMGQGNNATACSQTAGSAIGCELMVFDISSSTNPIYVAGRDASGGSRGTTGNTVVLSLTISGNYLYIGKTHYSNYCTQTAGSADGCGLMVFDITIPANPTYVAGRTSNGGATGLSYNYIKSLTISGNYLYAGKGATAYTCSETPGGSGADGCAFGVFEKIVDSSISQGVLMGNMTSASAMNDVQTNGIVKFTAEATTTNLTIATDSTTTAPSTALTIRGNYSNSGVYQSNVGTTYFDSNNAQALSGAMMESSAFHDTTFLGSGTKTFSSNASTTGNMTNGSGSTVVAPSLLTIGGDLTNQGTFTASSSLEVSGSLTNTDTFTAPTTLTVLNNFTNTGTFTASSTLTVGGNYTNTGTSIAPNNLMLQGDYTNTGTFLNNDGMVEIKTYFTKFITGRDASGDSGGTGSVYINSLIISGNHLYVGKSNNATACDQTAGSAIGCELMVFDISSTTNPVYVAGRDVKGDNIGTGNLAINSLTISGNYLYVGKAGNATACSQTAGSAIGCELMVFDISSTTNPVYVAGRDALGDSSGTGNAAINSLTVVGSTLYVGKSGSATACSQTAGSAIGCELMVFDISSTTNPIYVAGRDAMGNADGTANITINSLTISGNYLYVGKNGYSGACSQTTGWGAAGCELMVFDISSSTNPTYVAGRDASGDTSGTASLGIISLTTSGNHLYVGKAGNATACSQTAGSAIGCELMVFDISSSTNPVYVAGRDVSGGSNGAGSIYINSLIISGNYLYVGKGGDATACSQTAGSAIGCEFMVFGLAALSGSMTGANAFNSLSISGISTFNDNASTSNLTINTGATVVAPAELFISGDYQNNGTFTHNDGMVEINSYIKDYIAGIDSSGSATGTGGAYVNSVKAVGNYVYVGKGPNATACSQTAGSAIGCEFMVFDISSSTNPVYVAGRDSSGSATGTANIEFLSITVSGNYLYAGKYSDGTACSQSSGSATGCEIMVFDISSSTNPTYVAGRDASGNVAGTESNAWVSSLTVSGNYLFVGKSGNATACSQTAGSATGCELMVFDISIPTNPTYVAGRDISGSATGTGSEIINTLTTANNYLFVGKYGNGTACSQVVGSAIGCEIQVYDISSSTNPLYVAGRDNSGSDAGTGGFPTDVVSLTTLGNYLYVAKKGESAACSQTAGSAIGCELMVFDISSSTNPTYLAGRDAGGDGAGGNSVTINSLAVSGDYLYAGKKNNATACSQNIGEAIGCELMVFDISSSTNPIYVTGRDITTSATGTGSEIMNTISISGNHLYTGKTGSGTACSANPGEAIGCELMVFRTGELTGNLSGTSAFNNLSFSGGGGIVKNSASTTNLTISASAATFDAPLTVSGALTATTPGSQIILKSGATTTINTATITGSATSSVFLRATTDGTQANLDIQGSYSILYLDVKDSNACNGSGTTTATNSTDSGNNTCWSFGAGAGIAGISSYAHQTFALNYPTTTMSTIIITDDATPSITATNDIRIVIATSTVHMLWDTSNTTATFGGTASGKVSNPVSYEGNGSILVVPVTSDFSGSDTLTIDGLSYSQFTATNTATTALGVRAAGAGDTPDANDDKNVTITGSLTLANHSQSQVSDNFQNTTQSGVSLYRYTLTPLGENMTIDSTVFTLRGVNGVNGGDLTNLKLYRDSNENGNYDGGDVQIGGTGVVALSGQTGTITFSTGYTASTSGEYLLIGDVAEIRPGDHLTISLSTGDVIATGDLTVGTVPPVGSVSSIQHIRGGGGGGGGAVGGDAPAGGGIHTGGGQGAGEIADTNTGGSVLGTDPGYFAPTTNGSQQNQWTTPANGYNSDASYATAASAGLRQTYGTFGIGVPGTNEITGIEVKLEAAGTTAAGTIQVKLSWDGGTSLTALKSTATLTATDTIYTLGGPSDTWGHSWTPAETANGTFAIEVIGQPSGNTVKIDAIRVRIYHQATGGSGGGGGGEVLKPSDHFFAYIPGQGIVAGASIVRYTDPFRTLSSILNDLETTLRRWF